MPVFNKVLAHSNELIMIQKPSDCCNSCDFLPEKRLDGKVGNYNKKTKRFIQLLIWKKYLPGNEHISHLWKTKMIFKSALGGDLLVPTRVYQVLSLLFFELLSTSSRLSFHSLASVSTPNHPKAILMRAQSHFGSN